MGRIEGWRRRRIRRREDTSEGGVSLGAEDEGRERKLSPYLPSPLSFYPSPRGLMTAYNYPLRALGKNVFSLSR